MNALRTSIFLAWLVCGFGSVSHSQQTQPLRHAWEVDPDLGDIWIQAQSKRAAFIDVEELAAPQIQRRLNAAQSLCINHDRKGLRQKPRAIALLLSRLAGDEEPILVRRAMMSAACLLDDGEHAMELWQAAQSDHETRATVERACLKWRSPVALESWRNTLKNQKAVPSDVSLALEGLSIVGSSEDQAILVSTLRSNNSTPIHRLLAAKALGAIISSGLTELADEVMQSDIADRELVTAYLLHGHSDEGALKQLVRILNHGSETSKWVAATAIANQFPPTALSLAPEWTHHADSRIRILSLDVLQRESNTEALKLQATLLADPIPNVRIASRERLLMRAENGFRVAVDECISEQLQSEAWEALEQSIILIVQLQDRTLCPAMLKLLDHPQPEVHMHAGWALMELAEDPDILNQILTHTETLTVRLESGTTPFEKAEVIRLSFLLEALGRNRIAPALPMLIKYIPKDQFRMRNLSRASAIWSIGQIRADQHDAELRTQLCERLMDVQLNPEHYLVRFACLLALGQFAHLDSAETIEMYGGTPPNPLGYAAEWALKRIQAANP